MDGRPCCGTVTHRASPRSSPLWARDSHRTLCDEPGALSGFSRTALALAHKHRIGGAPTTVTGKGRRPLERIDSGSGVRPAAVVTDLCSS